MKTVTLLYVQILDYVIFLNYFLYLPALSDRIYQLSNVYIKSTSN